MYKFMLISFLLAAAISFARADTEEDARQFPADSIEDREKLLKDLFTDYNKENYPDNATVKFGLAIINVDFDVEHNLMVTNGWHRMKWTDNRLAWDETKSKISVLRVPPSKIWLPDIFLYNGPKPNMECAITNALIFPDGGVLVVPPCKLQSYCNLTLGQEHECMIKYGSWTFDSWTMDMVFYDNAPKADTADYLGGKFKVTKNEAIRHVKKYDCCKEPYVDLQFNLGFKQITEGEKLCKAKE